MNATRPRRLARLTGQQLDLLEAEVRARHEAAALRLRNIQGERDRCAAGGKRLRGPKETP